MPEQFVTPQGPRLIVKDIDPEIPLLDRCNELGLVVIGYEKDVPKPTTGIVMALGPDPLVQENIHVGDIVHFNWHSGANLFLSGRKFRLLEYREVLLVQREAEPASQSPSTEAESPSPES